MTHSSKVSDPSQDTYRLVMDARFAALEEMIAVAEVRKANQTVLAFVKQSRTPNRAA